MIGAGVQDLRFFSVVLELLRTNNSRAVQYLGPSLSRGAMRALIGGTV